MKTAAEIVLLGERLRHRHKFARKIPVKIDDGGLGGGVTDRLVQIKSSDPKRYWWLEVLPVHFGKVYSKHPYYHDSTTVMMAFVRDRLSQIDDEGKKKPVDLILPNDSDLIAQLSSRKYELNGRNKIVVESKRAMKERGLPSPDEADCLLLCCLPVNLKDDKPAAKDKR